jgi:hypothetical protein
MLIAIGYWRSRWQPDLPHPKDLVDDRISGEARKLLVSYLDKGKIVMHCLGFSTCRFNCGIPDHEMGNSCLTDGKFIWPEKLSHYISEHKVWLPEPFIFHVKGNQNYNPSDIDLEKVGFDKKYGFHDFKWWKENAV